VLDLGGGRPETRDNDGEKLCSSAMATVYALHDSAEAREGESDREIWREGESE